MQRPLPKTHNTVKPFHVKASRKAPHQDPSDRKSKYDGLEEGDINELGHDEE